ncbi:MAG TPA: efflux RND transporter periplasmic adaptor subunit, partial [Polyangiaceae bacterium LLY-WYZ-15_(1-7)]|nr:efflux RND transporter periplasmic adaptor subunit [Polyangiaceae bacterium LLY-WYZ-15_(1-7)]
GRGAAAGADVGLPFPAHVRAVHVAPGDRVEAGAPLVEVLAPELALAVAEARGARAELAVHAERLANLRTLRGENLVRASALHEVEHAMAALRSRLGVAEARLRSAGVGPAERRELSARGALTLKSPVDGTVRAVDARLGAAVDAGLPLVRVAAAPGPVRVEVQLPRPLPPGPATLLREGAPLALAPVGEPVREPESGLWVGWFEPAEGAGLLAGERWPVEWAGAGEGLLEVPADALRAQGHDARLRRRRDGAEPADVEVDVVRVDGARALVRPRDADALREGDRVAIDPATVLSEEPAS